MPQISLLQTSFGRGEISDRARARVDHQGYQFGLKQSLNALTTHTGSWMRRPGTLSLYNGPEERCLYHFRFAYIENYILEFSHKKVKVYANRRALDDGGVAVEFDTPYEAPDFCDLTFAQSADELIIVHHNYPPAKITRTGPLAFFHSDLPLNGGPFGLNCNVDTECKLSLSTSTFIAEQGYVTNYSGTIGLSVGDVIEVTQAGQTYQAIVTAAGLQVETDWNQNFTLGPTSNFTINGVDEDGDEITIQGGVVSSAPKLTGVGCSPFAATDVGRLVRIQDANGDWQVVEILNVINSGEVEVAPAKGRQSWDGRAVPETDSFCLGDFYQGNYPTAVSFYDTAGDRLVFANTPTHPQSLWMSSASDYFNFNPTDANGVVTEANAVARTLNDREMNAIWWLEFIGEDLIAGSANAIRRIRPSTRDSVSPFDLVAVRQRASGSADVQPVAVGEALAYVDETRTKLMSLAPKYQPNVYDSTILSLMSEHIPYKRTKQLAFQRHPFYVVWGVLDDGTLYSVTLLPEQEMVAWHRHRINGSDDADDYGRVVSVAVIPSPDRVQDDVYFVVERGGSYSTEILTPYWYLQDPKDLNEAHFLDGAVAFEGAPTQTVTGLPFPDGAVLQAFGDGEDLGNVSVSAGEVTLPKPVSKGLVGYGYTSQATILPPEIQTSKGTIQSYRKRIHGPSWRFLHSVGGEYSSDQEIWDAFKFTEKHRPEQNEIHSEWYNGRPRDGGWEHEPTVSWRQTRPLPMEVLLLTKDIRTGADD